MSQYNFRYNGSFSLGSNSGMASYTFKMSDQDTIKNGAFEFIKSNPENLFHKNDSYLSIKGDFVNNQPSNNWEFKFGEFEATDSSYLADYQYRVNISGKQTHANGRLKNGKADGIWTHVTYKIENSIVKDTVFRSSLSFKEGVPQQSFRIQNENEFLAGRFLRKGLAHDRWELYSTESIETTEAWEFSEGLLKSISINQYDSIQSFPIYNDPIENSEIMNLDEKYLSIIQIQQRLSSTSRDTLPSGMLSMLKKNTGHYQKIEKLLQQLGEIDFMPKFKVKVASYPLLENELALLDSAAIYFQKVQSISDQLLKSTQLNLLKFTDPEVFFQLKAVQAIKSNHLKFIGDFMQYYEKGLLEHIKRDSLLSKLWTYESQIFPIEVKYEEGDSLKSSIFSVENFTFYKDEIGLEAIYSLCEYTYLYTLSLKEKLEQKLKTKELQNELQDLESGLINESNSLNKVIDSLQEKTSGNDSKLLTAIKSFSNEALKNYSSISDIVVKQEEAKNLTECMINLKMLANRFSSLKSQQKEIENLYIDEIWNPFTSTVMSEEVKSRIVESYTKILIPFIKDEIKNHLACDNVVSLYRLEQKIYDRMLELREEDTEKLERKLRKEKDPKSILTLFEIDANYKSELE
ncbi:hypothetical protein [Marivirga arenosa]|uniref:Uncharacterized protein n=1 Tax=Marivirga arenosa TaxID=3059076 RepID=A0AA51ZX83_9BACT|nr:hypothetical protein [Marivirga sp. BKB1-2]WNB18392.1 hypothetical protein QYS47_30110 [Marivirga sp. BKB1-2]